MQDAATTIQIPENWMPVDVEYVDWDLQDSSPWLCYAVRVNTAAACDTTVVFSSDPWSGGAGTIASENQDLFGRIIDLEGGRRPYPGLQAHEYGYENYFDALHACNYAQ